MNTTPYKNGQHQLPPELKRRNKMIVALYKAGHSYADIGRQMDISRQRVYQIVQMNEGDYVKRRG